MDAAQADPHGPIWQGATVLMVDDEPTSVGSSAACSKPKAFMLKRLRTASPH